MNIRRIGKSFALAAACAVAIPALSAFGETVDILYLNDGRILEGEVVSEDGRTVVFNFTDPKIGITTKLEFSTDDVDRIEHDVERAEEAEEDAGDSNEYELRRGSEAELSDDAAVMLGLAESYGARRADPSNMDASSFYIVPMNGTVGTDINLEIYEKMIEDIRQHDPDYLVIVMECTDHNAYLEDEGFSIADPEFSRGDSDALDMYRQMISLFHDELGDIPQVLWVHDSVGISSILALSWDTIYMKPEAHLAGASRFNMFFERVRADENMYGKFREAYMGWLRGFAEYGDTSLHIVDAMMRPEMTLSADWKGRDVEWYLNLDGEYMVDGSPVSTVNFDAKGAEDVLISDGTAETIDDLALLMGIREYRIVEGGSKAMYDRYTEDWRRTYDNAVSQMDDYEKFLSWATGEDTLAYLGRAKGCLEYILGAMRRYAAVNYMFNQQGIQQLALEIEIERLKEAIRAIRANNGRGGRGGGGGGMSGGGGRRGG